LTLPTPEGGGFSGYARPTGPLWRLRGLPDPTLVVAERQDVPGGVMVTMQASAALRAGVPADRQACRDKHTAVRTPLAGGGRVDRHHLPTGACCLVGKDGEEPAPAHVPNGLGQRVVLHHRGDLQRVVLDRINVTYHRQRGCLLDVLPLAADGLVCRCQQPHGLAPALAALLTA
jgi:hypothetical protein